MNTKFALIGFLIVTLAGCAHSSLDGPLPDYTGADAATLIIQRPPGGLGALGGVHVALDGTPLGEIGVGEYWKISVKPGLHNVSNYTDSLGIRLPPNALRCVVIGLWAEGVYIHPADNCPPPSSWKLAAQSGD